MVEKNAYLTTGGCEENHTKFIVKRSIQGLGKEGEILAVIITITFKNGTMEKLIELGEIESSKTVLDTEFDPEESIKNEAGAILIKKIKLI